MLEEERKEPPVEPKPTPYERALNHVKRYVTVPESREAVKITQQNIGDLAVWCGGDIRDGKWLIVPGTTPDSISAASVNSYLVRDSNTGKFSAMDADEFENRYSIDPASKG